MRANILSPILCRISTTTFRTARCQQLQSIRYESIEADSIHTRSPYEELKVKINSKSTRENPMKVNAYGNERTIACVCDDMRFMTLKKGEPVRCKCGHWFQLVDAHKFWIKDQEP